MEMQNSGNVDSFLIQNLLYEKILRSCSQPVHIYVCMHVRTYVCYIRIHSRVNGNESFKQEYATFLLLREKELGIFIELGKTATKKLKCYSRLH